VSKLCFEPRFEEGPFLWVETGLWAGRVGHPALCYDLTECRVCCSVGGDQIWGMR
jgi:hypothetical protein